MAGLLNTLTLLASGIGGVLFGFIADRIGRKRALMLSILTYSFLVRLRTGDLHFDAGGISLYPWTWHGRRVEHRRNAGCRNMADRITGASDLDRAKFVGHRLCGWALVSGLVLRHFDWRVVFFVGIIPALVTLWIQQRVPESELWRSTRLRGNRLQRFHFSRSVRGEYLRPTLVLLLVNFFGLFAWWGLFTWIPPYLSLPVEQGGRGFSVMNTTGLLVFLNLAGMFPGYSALAGSPTVSGATRFLLYPLARRCLCQFMPARSPLALLILGAARVLWHWLLLRLRNHWQRNFPHRSARALWASPITARAL